MHNTTKHGLDQLALVFEASRHRLRNIALLKTNPRLLQLIDVDDLLQETWTGIIRRLEHFHKADAIPIFVRFRAMLLQTIVDMERKYIVCQKRDIKKSISFDQENTDKTEIQQRWNRLADTVTSPCTHLVKQERYTLLKELLEKLPENDKIIIEMRHFENLSNKECAAALGIEEKNASIRYVRALRRFQNILLEWTEFRS